MVTATARTTLRALIVLLLACGPGAPAFAALSAQLSDTAIDELETVRLVVRKTGTRETQSIDLTALETDFHVMGSNTSSQYKFFNGREQSWVDYQITLQPKRAGQLVIPPVSVGDERTPELTLTVRPLSAQTRQKIEQLVFFETEFSAPQVYVQAELIMTRRLMYSNGVQLYTDLPGAPELADAVVLTLGETSSATVKRGERTYGVVEQRYAIFPEVSGELVLPAISVTASVRLIEGGRVSRKGVRVGTETTRIRVMPVPAGYPAEQPWLPAKAIRGIQVLNPDRLSHDVGDTLTHELLIHIEGNIGSIAAPAPLSLAAQEFRTYPQAPVIEDDSNGGSVKGSRLQTTSLVPLIPGTLTVPDTRITWFNTNTEQIEEAIIRGQQISVTGTALQLSEPTATAPSANDATNPPPTADGQDLPGVEPRVWLSVAALAVLVFGLWWARRRIWRGMRILIGISRSGPPQRARRAVLEALEHKSPGPILDSVATYIHTIEPQPTRSIIAYLQVVAPHAAAACARAQELLYAADATGGLTASELDAVRRFVELTVAASRATRDPLPALY
ncbi:MAG: BatD family protein [Pseudomonadota bacterium]